MNRIFTLTGALVVAGSLSAQSPRDHIKRAPKGIAPPAAPVRVAPHGAAKGGGSLCVLSEDFESATIASLQANGWNIGADIEQQDQDNVGQGTYVPAWRIATSDDGSSTYLQLPDDPPGNHFILANDDGTPCNCNMDSIGLITPSMDFTGQTAMSISYRAYSDEDFGGGQMFVWGSGDGGTTWAVIDTVPAILGSFQSIVTDLSAFDGLSNVKVAWSWSDNGEWATGVAVDDVCAAPILPNNLTLQRAYSADVAGDPGDLVLNTIEYTYLPLEQAQPMNIAAAVINNGGLAQTNVVLTTSVYLNSQLAGTFSSDPLPTLAPGESQTLVVRTGWVPTETGDVTATVEVTSDVADEQPSDNDGGTALRITGPTEAELYNSFGVDDDAAQSFGGQGTDQYKIANLVEIVNEGSIAYGIYAALGDVLEEGTIIRGQMLDAATDNFDPIVGSDDVEVQPWFANEAGTNNMTFIQFTEPTPLAAQTEVLPALVSFGGTEVHYCNSGGSAEQTTFIYTMGDNGLEWFYTTTTPMVRLVLADAPAGQVGMEELEGNGFSVGPNVPNPCNDNTTVQYELRDARRVSLSVMDVNGKVVLQRDLGLKGKGRHAFDINAEQLAQGAYSYTLTAGEDRLTRRMVVAK